MKALNAAYGITDQRTWWEKRLIAVALTLVFSLFTLTALLLVVFGVRLGEAIGDFVGPRPLFTLTWKLAQIPVVILLVLTGVTLVYYLAPAMDRVWSWVTPGSAFAVVSWLLMSLGLRFYVGYFDYYNATYGSIGGLILLMLWLYWSGVAPAGRRGDRFGDRASGRRARHASPKAGSRRWRPAARRLAGPTRERGRSSRRRARPTVPRGPISRPLTSTTRARSGGMPRQRVTSVTVLPSGSSSSAAPARP